MRLISFATICAFSVSPVLAAPALTSFLAPLDPIPNAIPPIASVNSVIQRPVGYVAVAPPPKYSATGYYLASLPPPTPVGPPTTQPTEKTSEDVSTPASEATTSLNTPPPINDQPKAPVVDNMSSPATTTATATSVHSKVTKCYTRTRPITPIPTPTDSQTESQEVGGTSEQLSSSSTADHSATNASLSETTDSTYAVSTSCSMTSENVETSISSVPSAPQFTATPPPAPTETQSESQEVGGTSDQLSSSSTSDHSAANASLSETTDSTNTESSTSSTTTEIVETSASSVSSAPHYIGTTPPAHTSTAPVYSATTPPSNPPVYVAKNPF